MDLGLKGKVAFVAAASKGMGKACALGLAAEGARVLMCARGEAGLKDAAAEVKGTASQAVSATQDEVREQAGHVTDQTRDSGRALADEARQRTGPS